jgi:hypothetical protein
MKGLYKILLAQLFVFLGCFIFYSVITEAVKVTGAQSAMLSVIAGFILIPSIAYIVMFMSNHTNTNIMPFVVSGIIPIGFIVYDLNVNMFISMVICWLLGLFVYLALLYAQIGNTVQR